MTFQFQKAYSEKIEQGMRMYYQSLSEKDRRRYTAIECLKLGYGGRAYLCRVLGCTEELIIRGEQELAALPHDPAENRIREPGAGRPKTESKHPDIQKQLQQTIDDRTAGDPMTESQWTDLAPQEIADRLQQQTGLKLSAKTVKRLLTAMKFGRRKIQKVRTKQSVPQRNEQFEYIAQLREQFINAGNPVFCIDTKKKEPLGQLHREGTAYCRTPQRSWDHDYANWAEGMVIPHGIYDLQRNQGWLTLGTSHDTSEFACESFLRFWTEQGCLWYPQAKQILWLCDGGGSNGCRTHIFKWDLQQVVNQMGIPIRVAHYPPYCSKYNPIEHRLFCHVSRACQGMLFDTLQTVVRLMSKTHTSKGLKVEVRTLDKEYEIGRKVSKKFKQNLPVTFDKKRKLWNYTFNPQLV